MKKGNMQSKKQNKVWAMGVMAVTTFSIVLGLLFWGLASTIHEVKNEAISREPEAILASAGVSEDREVLLPISYYDQRSDECVNIYDVSKKDILNSRQFEWERCGYYNKEIEKGLVGFELGEDYLPVFSAGGLTPNKGIGASQRWFGAVEGKSASYIGAIKMEYVSEGAVFYFERDDFYPLDDAKFSDGDVVNVDGHNHLFTLNFAVPFTVLNSGDESFEIKADDDTFVFVGNKLAIDMGGIHDAEWGRFVIHDDGEVYAGVGEQDLAYTGIKLNEGDGSLVRIFHADRDSSDSVFRVKFSGMNVTIVDTQMAKDGKGNGMQIAYDPTDPTYAAPLGQSVIMRPDNTRGYIIMATIEGVMVVVFSVMVVVAAKMVMRKTKNK